MKNWGEKHKNYPGTMKNREKQKKQPGTMKNQP